MNVAARRFKASLAARQVLDLVHAVAIGLRHALFGAAAIAERQEAVAAAAQVCADLRSVAPPAPNRTDDMRRSGASAPLAQTSVAAARP
jgi:hypothetical protein